MQFANIILLIEYYNLIYTICNLKIFSLSNVYKNALKNYI